MPKQLLVIAGPEKGQTFLVPDEDWLLVGRSRATQARLSDPHVSKVHCKVECKGDHVSVTDLDSTGGTFVNDKRLEACVLRKGDVLRIGGTQLLLQEANQQDEDGPGTLAGVPLSAPHSALDRGELTGQLLSHYRLGRVLANAQSGLIYEALDTRDQRRLAVKVYTAEFTQNDDDVQRFVRAMRTLLPLRHPNLVSIYGAGKSGLHCYSAMELVEGENLAQILARGGKQGPSLSWQQALRVGIHVARALDYLHGEKVLCRNLAPRTILLRTSDQVAKLADLGIAKALAGIHAEQITRPGELVGDVHCMPPERTVGSGAIDARSDLYSLGALLYVVLTGRPPLEGPSTLDTLVMIRQTDPEPPSRHRPGIPPAFEAVVMKLLRKRPEDRFPSAASLSKELDELARIHTVTV